MVEGGELSAACINRIVVGVFDDWRLWIDVLLPSDNRCKELGDLVSSAFPQLADFHVIEAERVKFDVF